MFNKHKITASVSKQIFSCKEEADANVNRLLFSTIELAVQDLAHLVFDGHAFTCVFKDKNFAQLGKSKEDVTANYLLVYDIDGIEKGVLKWDKSLEDTLPLLKKQPSFAYESCSNGLPKKGYRFRLIYALDKPVTDREEYKAIIRYFAEWCGIPSEYDFHSEEIERNWFGNMYSEHTVINPTVIRYDDIVSDKRFEEIKAHLNDKPKTETKSQKKSSPKLDVKSLSPYSKIMVNDAMKLTNEEFLSKYVGKVRHLQALVHYDDDDCAIHYYGEGDYKLFTTFDKNPLTKKPEVKQKVKGNQRKQFIYSRLVGRRNMIPDLTFGEILYAAIYDLHHYVDDTDSKHKIGRKRIIETAWNAFNADMNDEKNKAKGRPKGDYCANVPFCIKHNVSKRAAINIGKGQETAQRIKELYDPNLFDTQNLKKFEENGLKISPKTLQRWKKKNLP